MAEETHYLTVEQAAVRLQTSHEMVRRMLRTGRLRGMRLGGKRAGWRIPASEIAALFADDSRPRSGPVPARLRHGLPAGHPQSPGLAPLLERAEHHRQMGNQAEAARWQRLADQLLAESGSVE